MPIMTSPADLRAAARRGEWRGTTGGHCPAYQQTNVVILPQEAAAEFAAFCTRNPRPCPITEIMPPGDPEPVRSAPGADLRADVPGYRIYRKGELAEQRIVRPRVLAPVAAAQVLTVRVRGDRVRLHAQRMPADGAGPRRRAHPRHLNTLPVFDGRRTS